MRSTFRFFGILFITFLLSIYFTDNSYADKNKKSNSCSKINSIKFQSDIKYKCVKIGKKSVWQKVNINKQIIIKKNLLNTSTIPDNENINNIQKIIDNLEVKNYRDSMNITIFTESDKDGIFMEGAISSLNSSIDFYGSLGLLTKQDIYIFIGRSEKWFKEISIDKCNSYPLNLDQAAATTCPEDNNRAGIWSYISKVGTLSEDEVGKDQNFSDYFVQKDLSGIFCGKQKCITHSRWLVVLSHMPHELFHTYQSQWWRNGSGIGPRWLMEGSAVVLQQMATVKFYDGQMSYKGYIEEISHSGSVANRLSCTLSFSKIEDASNQNNGCVYTQGSHAVEVIISKYGGIKTLNKLLSELKKDNFVKQFEEIVGISYNDFIKEVDAHSVSMGYTNIK